MGTLFTELEGLDKDGNRLRIVTILEQMGAAIVQFLRQEMRRIHFADEGRHGSSNERDVGEEVHSECDVKQLCKIMGDSQKAKSQKSRSPVCVHRVDNNRNPKNLRGSKHCEKANSRASWCQCWGSRRELR